MTAAAGSIRVAAARGAGTADAGAVQEPVMARETAGAAGSMGAWERATGPQRTRARERLDAVLRSDELVAAGFSRAEADACAGSEMDPPKSQWVVGDWRARVAGAASGERLAALLDLPGRGRRLKAWDGPGADDLWAAWCADYLREESPNAAGVHRRLARIAAKNHWRLPPLRAFLRRTESELTAAEIARARGGVAGAMATVPPQERTVEELRPLSIVCGDGRVFDVQVVRDGEDAKPFRPTVWLFQDVPTRRLLAWRIGATESAELVRLALHDVVMRHGVPEAVLVDNTFAASSRTLTGGQRRRRFRADGAEPLGVLALLEIELHQTAVDRDAAGRGVGRGRSKPVERAFLDLQSQIEQHPELAGAGTGRDPRSRHETHRRRAVPLAVFERILDEAVREYNARPGRRTEIAAGRSINDAWAEEIARATPRRLSPSQAAVLLLAAENVRIARDGSFRLRLGRGPAGTNRYHAQELVGLAGKSVTVRIDPEALHGDAHVWTTDGRYVCAAGCLLPVGFADAAAAGEHNRRLREAGRLTKRQREIRKGLDGYRRELAAAPPPEHPPAPEPAAVRLVANGRLPELPPARSAPSVPGPPPKSEPARPQPRGLVEALRTLQRSTKED